MKEENKNELLSENLQFFSNIVNYNDLSTSDFDNITQRYKVESYRKLCYYSEVDNAVEEIINEAIIESDDGDVPISLNLNENAELFQNFGVYVEPYFEIAVKLLNFRNEIYNIFRYFYVDGLVMFGIIRSEEDVTRVGNFRISDIVMLDPRFVTKTRDKIIYRPDKRKTIFNFFSGDTLDFALNDVIFAFSGNYDTIAKQVISPLQKALKAANLLYLMEDSSLVYALVRSPTRRVWNINFGNNTGTTAREERIMKDIAAKHRRKLAYNTETGAIEDREKTYMSLIEDIYLPKTNGGPQIDVNNLPGDIQALDSFGPLLSYYKEKLYEALNIPFTRLASKSIFKTSRESEISREEYKFSRFITRLRTKFSTVVTDLIFKLMVDDGILNDSPIDYQLFREMVFFKYETTNIYKDQQENMILSGQLELLNQIAPYVGTIFPTIYVYKNVLKMSDEEIIPMLEALNTERAGMPPVDPARQGEVMQDEANDNMMAMQMQQMIQMQQAQAQSQTQEKPPANEKEKGEEEKEPKKGKKGKA